MAPPTRPPPPPSCSPPHPAPSLVLPHPCRPPPPSSGSAALLLPPPWFLLLKLPSAVVCFWCRFRLGAAPPCARPSAPCAATFGCARARALPYSSGYPSWLNPPSPRCSSPPSASPLRPLSASASQGRY